jgi:hypothetical protein
MTFGYIVCPNAWLRFYFNCLLSIVDYGQDVIPIFSYMHLCYVGHIECEIYLVNVEVGLCLPREQNLKHFCIYYLNRLKFEIV